MSLFGLFGSEDTTVITTTQQTTEDKRIAQEQGVATSGNITDSVFNVQDAGALTLDYAQDVVTGAYDYGRFTAESGERFFSQSVGGTLDLIDRLLTASETARSESLAAGQEALAGATKAATTLARGASGESIDKSQIIAALIGAGALILVAYFAEK